MTAANQVVFLLDGGNTILKAKYAGLMLPIPYVSEASV
jgi:hypothetical protein